MNLLICLLFSILIFFITSCKEKCPACDAGYAVLNAYVKSYQKNENVSLSAFGGGFLDNHVNHLVLRFSSYRALNLEQARIFFVSGAKDFLRAIDQDLKIRPYLNDYPFPYKEIAFSISFFKKNGGFVDKEYVSYVSIVEGTIFYCHYNETNRRLETFYSEPYPDAYKIVTGESLESSAMGSEPSSNS